LPGEVARAGKEQEIGFPQREHAQHRKQHQRRDDQHRGQYAGRKAGRTESRPSVRSTRPRDDRLATVTRLRVLRRRDNMRKPSARRSVDSCRVWSDSFHRIFHRTIYLSSYKTEQSRYRSSEYGTSPSIHRSARPGSGQFTAQGIFNPYFRPSAASHSESAPTACSLKPPADSPCRSRWIRPSIEIR